MTAAAGGLSLEWREFALGDLLSFSNGINADKSAYGAGVPFANVLEVITNESLAESDIPGRISVSPKVLRRFEVKHGDVLFNRTSETQEEVGLAAIYVGRQPVVFGGFVFRGRPLTDELTLAYSKYAFRSPFVRSQIIARGQGGIRANIGQRDLKSVTVRLPSRREQLAIAGALDDVSAVISGLQRLISKKQAIKQGMMQQLLTARCRIPGFTSEWEAKPLSDDVDLLSGHHVLAEYCNSDGYGVPYLTGPSDFPDGQIRQTKFTTRPTTMCQPKDILVTVKGSGAGTLVEADASYCISRQLMAIRSTTWSPRFLLYSLLQNASNIRNAVTGLIPGLSRSDILDQRIPVPPVAEQRAIANVLSDVDAELAALQSLLVKTREAKQGMMQQLLTGRTRLPPVMAIA